MGPKLVLKKDPRAVSPAACMVKWAGAFKADPANKAFRDIRKVVRVADNSSAALLPFESKSFVNCIRIKARRTSAQVQARVKIRVRAADADKVPVKAHLRALNPDRTMVPKVVPVRVLISKAFRSRG